MESHLRRRRRGSGICDEMRVRNLLASSENFQRWLLSAPPESVVGYREVGVDPLSYYLLGGGILGELLDHAMLPGWARLFQGRLRFTEDGRLRRGEVLREEALAELDYAARPFIVRDHPGVAEMMARPELLRAYPRLAAVLVDAELAYVEVRTGGHVIRIERVGNEAAA